MGKLPISEIRGTQRPLLSGSRCGTLFHEGVLLGDNGRGGLVLQERVGDLHLLLMIRSFREVAVVTKKQETRNR